MNIVEFPNNQYSSKTQLIFHLIKLAQAKGRDITIGSNNPKMRYEQIREQFPDVIMVVDEHNIIVKGSKR
jgi:hypothetical protein